ncbi:MAG: class I SAM-dependent methyltransferase [Brachymonas sp.]|nr:class I SAM-dependent methyltransferase [Brachymonas sp.]
MAQRLAWIKQQPVSWVNWRALNSGAALHAQIAGLYPKSDQNLAPAGIESAQSAHVLVANQGALQSFWNKLQSKAQAMAQPVADGAAQLVWANMALHSEPDPAAAVKAWHRMLAVNGF